MSTFNKLYERTLARLLADHTAKGVPPDLDLWPTIQQRLAERDEAIERATEQEQSGLLVNAMPLPMQPQRPAEGRGRRLWRSAGALAGVATLALFAVVTTLAISGLANRATKNPTQVALSISGRAESTTLFSLTFSPPTTRQYISGFSVSEDGTFWIAGNDRNLLQYSPTGTQLDTRQLSAYQVVDLEVSNGSIWVLDRTREVFKIGLESKVVELLKPYRPDPGFTGMSVGPNDPSATLRSGGDGQMLIDEGSKYRVVADQTTGKDGQVSPLLLDGYPANGKLYKVDEQRQDSILAGNVPVIVKVSDRDSFSSAHVFKVMPDGSFYVVAAATTNDFCCQSSATRAYILHYRADGTLIEHARTPDLGQRLAVVKQLAVSANGLFYAAQTELDNTGLPTNRVNILRINFVPASELLPPLPTPTPRFAQTVDDSTPVFSLPIGAGGIRYIKYPTGDYLTPGFAASAPDGTFWFSDGDSRLLHFDATGKRLGSIPLPADKGSPFEMQVRDGDFWLYYLAPTISGGPGGYSEPNTHDTIYRLGPDGREIAKYTVPDYIKGRTMSGFRTGFILGEQGEVLLKGEFTNLIPSSNQFPSPVPTEQIPQTPTKLYWKLVDAQGNLASEGLEGYTSGGRLYVVRQPYRAAYGRGDITVGDVEIRIPSLRGQFNAFDLLQVAPDGSFYVKVTEEEDTGGPYITVYTTIYHYSLDGKMIERAQLPMKNVRFLTGHPGSFYVIEEQPGGELRGAKQPPDRVEVRRLKFHPADQPLAVMPAPEPPALPTPVLPTGNTPTPHVRLPIDFPLPTATNAPLPPVSDPTTTPTLLPGTQIPLPGTQIPPTMLASAEPVSFVRDGEGFRLDVHEGAASFGFGSSIRGSSPWIGPSRLAVRWDPILTQEESRSYMLNMETGKLEALPWSAREWSAVSRADGKRVVLVKAGDSALTVNLFNLETGASETIYDFAPTAKQWAGADTHVWAFGGVPQYGYAETTWIGDNNFVLSVTPRINRDTTDYAARLLLVDIARREVRLLAERGTLADSRPDYPLLWQSGGVDGGLQILDPPYTGQPTIIVPSGPWIRDWALSPGGQRVAWVEAKAPPGDWSRKLPYTCRPCGGKDPEPEVEAIAVWDRATGQIERSPAPNLIWSLGDNTTQQSGSLHWRNDAPTLLYATHIADKGGAEGAGQTALRELTADGRSTLLTEYAWYGNLEVLWEAKDRTVYYYISGQSYSGSGSIARLRPDGKLETLYPQTSHQRWRLDREGRLAVLRGQGITVTDLTNGQAREALFPQAGAGEFDLGWSSIDYLIPLSPDGLRAAFAGTNSDAVIVSPDGRPDRGRIVYIAPVK